MIRAKVLSEFEIGDEIMINDIWGEVIDKSDTVDPDNLRRIYLLVEFDDAQLLPERVGGVLSDNITYMGK